ncbi:hypothetical protein BR93DRAFT_955829 [Coniochaeta sp. PMI_546]|nr:hypothetical protein BR93DRAFT_955829 [Coniochaeta sp. PMI_546]
MFPNLRKYLSSTREKTNNSPSPPTSTESSGGNSQSLDNLHSLYHARTTPQQAPLARGVEATSSYIDGHWNFDAFANLITAQNKARKQARKHRNPVPNRKPYSLVPGGHQETIAWISRPNSPETLERLFAVRDEAARRKNARFVQGFNLTRTLPEPHGEHHPQDVSGCEEVGTPPRITRFKKVDNGFIPLTKTATREVKLTVSTAVNNVGLPHEDAVSNNDDLETGNTGTESLGLGIFIEGQGTGETPGLNQPSSTDAPDEDESPTNSRWSYSSDSSDASTTSSDSSASFERWASGNSDDDLDLDRFTNASDDEGTSSTSYDQAERSILVKEKARQAVLPPPGSKLSEIDAFAEAWSANVADHSDPSPRPPYGPPLRRHGKYHYTSAAAARRFDYIKSYLSLREGSRPINIFLLIIHYRRAAACDAARRNPAFLRAALDIDWDGILDELPHLRHKNDHLQIYNRHVIKTWLDCDGYMFTETDRHGDPIFVLEDEASAKLTWPELVAREDLERLEKRRYDYRMYDYRLWRRLNGLDSGNLHARRRWQKPGSSNLGWILTAPV